MTAIHNESINPTTIDSDTRKKNQTHSVTFSSVLLAKRFSSTLLAPTNMTVTNLNNTDETTITTKKQHNPRRHVFKTNLTAINTDANEDQNPIQSIITSPSGEKVKFLYFLVLYSIELINGNFSERIQLINLRQLILKDLNNQLQQIQMNLQLAYFRL